MVFTVMMERTNPTEPKLLIAHMDTGRNTIILNIEVYTQILSLPTPPRKLL